MVPVSLPHSPEEEIESLAALFRAFADPARIRILNLLAHQQEVCNSDVEFVTGYGGSKVSRHFAYLKQAGIVHDRREGLWIHYSLRTSTGAVRAKLDRVLVELPQFYRMLAEDVSKLRQIRSSAGAASKPFLPDSIANARRGDTMFATKKRILFLCQNNAARSQMAEAFLRKYGGDQFEVHSAGMMATEIHPFTVQVMKEVGIDIAKQRSKGVNEYLGKKWFNFVITLCLEAEEECPRLFPGVGRILQWPFEDAAGAHLPDDAKLQKFRSVRDRIEQKVKDWLKD